jgi:type I restriction enzyme S subunit
MDDICFGITSGSTPPKNEFDDLFGAPYLKVYNIRNQFIDFEYKPQFVNVDYHSIKLKRSILYPGDVIMNIVGPPLGKVAIIPDTYPEWNCNQAITFFRPIVKDFNTYIYTYIKAGIFLQSIDLIGTAGQDNISVTKSRSIALPVPPLEEQHRIVAKVDELMTLCDQLKTRLNTAQTTQLQLADTVVDEALN